MSNVIVDIEEVRRFAFHLKKIAMELRGISTDTKVRMHNLNSTWKDNENAKFQQQFDQDIKPLERLVATAEEYSRFLEKKASSLDSYLNMNK